ncbi:MAG: DNA alkylation repair protein [Planctomycetaceae bacterium]|nr:DNA alkylation repair protein [Planctomycetaceae bacterium]
MDLDSVMSRLKSLGTAQNVKVYKRHGAGENVFGVSCAELKKLAKKIGQDHDLATELWETGNSDARSLAMMVADPDEVTPTLATQWMKDVDYYLHGNEVAAVVAQSDCGLSKMRQWRKQKSEYARATGYAILACMLKDDPDSVDEVECERILKDIELEIHRSPNRARHSMVMAVIAIGIYKEDLRDAAIECGDRIGDVDVDHGETDCKTPKIGPYIARAVKRSSSGDRKVSV